MHLGWEKEEFIVPKYTYIRSAQSITTAINLISMKDSIEDQVAILQQLSLFNHQLVTSLIEAKAKNPTTPLELIVILLSGLARTRNYSKRHKTDTTGPDHDSGLTVYYMIYEYKTIEEEDLVIINEILEIHAAHRKEIMGKLKELNPTLHQVLTSGPILVTTRSDTKYYDCGWEPPKE